MKISTKISLFYLLSTIILTLFTSVTIYISFTKDLNDMVDEHLSEDTNQIKYLLDSNISNYAALKHLLFEEYWLSIAKNGQTVYLSDTAKLIPIQSSQIVDKTTLKVETNFINFTGNNDVFFRIHTKKFSDGTCVTLAIAMDDNIRENYKKIAIVTLATLIIISIFVYFLISLLLKPIKNISLTLRKLNEEKFNIGFTKDTDDEIGFLVESINLTFEKLRSHFVYQKNFLTVMSHELKTPLSVIKNHIELAIENEQVPLDVKQRFANDLEQISKLNQLIHRLLLLTRLEEKTVTPNFIKFNLSEFSDELCQFFSDLSESQNKTFKFELASNIYITGDRDLLYRAIFNILDNAIKYSPEASEIRFSLEQSSDSLVTLKVIDSAPAINQNIIKTAENSMFATSAYDKDGIRSGIGMRIIMGILKLHNLQYNIESNSSGNTFSVFIAQASN